MKGSSIWTRVAGTRCIFSSARIGVLLSWFFSHGKEQWCSGADCDLQSSCIDGSLQEAEDWSPMLLIAYFDLSDATCPSRWITGFLHTRNIGISYATWFYELSAR